MKESILVVIHVLPLSQDLAYPRSIPCCSIMSLRYISLSKEGISPISTLILPLIITPFSIMLFKHYLIHPKLSRHLVRIPNLIILHTLMLIYIK